MKCVKVKLQKNVGKLDKLRKLYMNGTILFMSSPRHFPVTEAYGSTFEDSNEKS